MGKKILHIVLIIIWLLVIFMFSNQVKEKSDKTSAIFEPAMNIVIKNKDVAVTVIRKTAHFLEYFILAFLILLAFKDYTDITYKQLIMIIIICMIASIFDEIHQSFVSGRAGRWYDVIIDTFASSTCLLIYKLKKPIKH